MNTWLLCQNIEVGGSVSLFYHPEVEGDIPQLIGMQKYAFWCVAHLKVFDKRGKIFTKKIMMKGKERCSFHAQSMFFSKRPIR